MYFVDCFSEYSNLAVAQQPTLVIFFFHCSRYSFFLQLRVWAIKKKSNNTYEKKNEDKTAITIFYVPTKDFFHTLCIICVDVSILRASLTARNEKH